MKKLLLLSILSLGFLSSCEKSDPQADLFSQMIGNYDANFLDFAGNQIALPQSSINAFGSAQIFKDKNGNKKFYFNLTIGTDSINEEIDIIEVQEFQNKVYLFKENEQEIYLDGNDLVFFTTDSGVYIRMVFRKKI